MHQSNEANTILFTVEREPQPGVLQEIRGTSGVLTSPGYPNKYQYFAQDHFYRITVPENKRIQVSRIFLDRISPPS